MSTHTFTAGFPACGLGAGARGFVEARAVIGQNAALFRNLGGVDVDPAGLADFERLSDGPGILGDIHTMQPADLIEAWGERAPDVVFSSTPCKGLSRLLGSEAAATAHYQALNRLTVEAFHLVVTTYQPPPKLLILENVPGIMSRGSDLLDQIRQLLVAHGYRIDESTHCAGELGGLGQRRRRFLLVARHEAQLPALLYSPPSQRVKACGEVIGPLPLPNDPSAGAMHVLPRISWINWVRLALIKPGGDWRDLPRAAPTQLGHSPRPGSFGVTAFDAPSATVTGSMHPARSNTAASVADPRIAVGATGTNAGSYGGRPGYLGVDDWNAPAPAVTGTMRPTEGTSPGSVADPRLVSPLADGQPRREVHRRHAVADFDQPFETVTGPGGAGVENIADSRVAVNTWANKHSSKYRVRSFDEPAGTITGDTDVQEGAQLVADPRIPLTCAPRAGAYGVADSTRPIETVTGSASIDNGVASIADARDLQPLPPGYVVMTIDEALALAASPKARPDAGVVPVIFSPTDGTWHRPLTTLELAVLQGLPETLDGEPLVLDGKSTAAWRERIGNAVPVGTARAIAEQMLRTLLAGALGMFVLGSTPIWVRHAPVPELYARRRNETPANEPVREVA